MGLLRRLFYGTGRIPQPLRGELDAEGLWLLDENLSGSMTLRSFRAPGKWTNYDKNFTVVAVAITRNRLQLWTGRKMHVNIPRSDPRYRTLRVSLDRPDRFCIGYDAEAFRTDRRGQVEIRATTPNAQRVIELIGYRA